MADLTAQKQKLEVSGQLDVSERPTTARIKKELRGVVNPELVRIISFVVITISLVASTLLCILAIWDFTKSDAIWRAIATFIVVIISTAIFTVVNEKLG
ncbi:MAG TPA: hypothetical protein VF644_17660 [Pyrinomonadaceae bacterium]|jgi:uncharacterized membrane protein YqjE